MKDKFWTSDWFVALVISACFFFFQGSAFLQGLEGAVYDRGVGMSTRDSGDDIRVIAIDDYSINNLGRWPWSREVHAAMVELLSDAGAKVIAPVILYSEEQKDAGLPLIEGLAKQFDEARFTGPQEEIESYRGSLRDAQRTLDTDSKLAESFANADNVVLGMQFIQTDGVPVGNPDRALPDYVNKYALTHVPNSMDFPGEALLQTGDAFAPIPSLGQRAIGIGHILNPQDADGSVRREQLVIKNYDAYYASQSLMIAAKSLNLDVSDIIVNLGDSVLLQNLEIRTDFNMGMQTFFYGTQEGGREPFPVTSFYDVYTGKVTPDTFKDKVILIGGTAFGVGTSFVTPISENMAPILIMAHNVASLLNAHFFISPTWAGMAQLLVFFVVAGYLIAVLPRLKAGVAATLSAVLFVALIAAELGLMTSSGMWLEFATPATLLFIGHLLITTKRFLVAEAGKVRADSESAESNKNLGLAMQQKGDLDMAFERFRRCPMDESIMETLYNLALDYERKRQFNKAHSVYQYMTEHDPKFRDLDTRLNRAKKLEETVLLGGAGAGPASGTMLLDDGGVSKPMLGRYEVEKELGKGAMGVVYLGRDPKINRVVAIKTMALAQEFEADELEEVKARFFREAETAGRLQHPNIVTIYDAGEEHDLAYIAMEFLEGHDLSVHTKKDDLLPLPLVLGIVFKSAMALDYAHKQNVVHRDIKPANLMYDPKKKSVKITDFGIARITDSSKTKTGMVLGTPSYMSPEQLSGKKVDGRSDLFSLGVMLYQLASGDLPFKGDSMATLMFKIANDEPPDILEIRPDLAKSKPGLAAVVRKSMTKDADARYQTGTEMARDLQKIAKQTAK